MLGRGQCRETRSCWRKLKTILCCRHDFETGEKASEANECLNATHICMRYERTRHENEEDGDGIRVSNGPETSI
jgi:hypothetical protein